MAVFLIFLILLVVALFFIYNTHSVSLTGNPEVSLEQMKTWAIDSNAHQRFIDIADVYWKYGELTGIRPDVLYAQSAYETGYGHYGGQVPSSHNNWAGIKTADGNRFEQFITPEEGVRAHFNHMSAYIGLKPIGEPHGRYYTVKSMSWSGKVLYVDQLSGKWASNKDYHKVILRMLREMAV